MTRVQRVHVANVFLLRRDAEIPHSNGVFTLIQKGDRALTKLDHNVFIVLADLDVMLQKTHDRPITELYDQVRPPPLRTPLDMPAGIGLALGAAAMLACMAVGLAAIFLPPLFEALRVVALVAFCIGLFAFAASGVLSVVGMATGLKNRVHIHRFDEEHAQMTALASDLAFRRRDVGELLCSVQFQLRMTARIHDRLPLFTGLVTGVATATSLALGRNSAFATEDLAWIAAGVGLGAAIARIFAHQVQDRLIRIEHVVQIATRLPGARTPKRKAS